MWLFDTAETKVSEEKGDGEDGGETVKARHGVDGAKRAEVLKVRGRMSVGELIRCRVRYFTDGGVMGSREFVRGYRKRSEKDERRVPRIMELGRDAGLHVMRQLRVDVVNRARNES